MTRTETPIFSVYELSCELKDLFNAPLFQRLTVVGEVKSQQVRSGTMYLTLIDTDDEGKTLASMTVLLFKSSFSRQFEVGDRVIVRGRLNYYQPNGSLSFIASSIEAYGQGSEQARLRAVYERLKNEGAFAEERKRPLRKYPRKIAIVTSGAGAAYRDIIDTLAARFPVSTVLYDAKVQGEMGPPSIIKALQKAYRDSSVDLIIVGRGGGSKSDLMAFNDENVVRTILKAPIPIVSAVGHEIDTSLTDYAADVKAITPTAAAIASVPSSEDVLHRMDNLGSSLKTALIKRLDDKFFALSEAAKSISDHSPKVHLLQRERCVARVENKLINAADKILEHKRRMLETLNISLSNHHPKSVVWLKEAALKAVSVKMENRLKRALEKSGSDLKTLKAKLETLNPLKVLDRGYAIVMKGGRPISSTREVLVDDALKITLKDGTVETIAKEVLTYGNQD